MTGRLVVASLVSAAIVLAAPFMGQLRAAIRSAFPGQFVVIVGGFVALSLVLAVLVAVRRIRERRAIRLGAIVAAMAIGASYSLATRSGIPDVDVVERVHFIEYGIITVLFYRAWRRRGDLSIFVLPVLAGLLVGTLDEWLQWFIPVRVGEARDVLLNLVAISCGLLFGAAIDPPPTFGRHLRPASLTGVCLMAAGVLLVFAAFVNAVHLGYAINDSQGIFKSHFTAEELLTNARERAERWRSDPPITLRRLSREDQFMDEGLWHVRRRNESWTNGDVQRAWSENVILEKYFTPVLDTRSYATPEPSRWAAAQREDSRSRLEMGGVFVSDAEPYPIFTVRKPLFWGVISLGVLGLILLAAGRHRYNVVFDRNE